MEREELERIVLLAAVSFFILAGIAFGLNHVLQEYGEKPAVVGEPAPEGVPATIVYVLAVSGFALLIAFGGIKYISWKNVLNSPVRSSIYRYIQENPGAHMRQICDTFDLNMTNASWHLRKLEETKYVSKKKDGKFLRYYPLKKEWEAK